MSTNKLLHIEKLRGISVLLVLFYHLDVPGFQYGYFGVDLFFVISGFLMAMIYGEIQTKDEVINFFVRRSGRLLPAYFVVLLLTTIIGIILVLPHEVELLMRQGLWSSALLPNFGFWQSAVYFNSIMFRPLLNFWSLGVELQFYLFFPLLLLVKRVSEKWLLTIAGLSFLIALATNFIDPKTAFFMLPSRLWEFLMGYYAFRFVNSRQINRPMLGLAALFTLLALLLALSIIKLESVFGASMLVVLLSAACIGLGFSTGSETNAFSKILVVLGKYSYSIYLVHFPIIVLLNYAPFDGNNLYIKNPTNLVMILAATAIAAYMLHSTVETKTRHSLSGKQLVIGTLSMCLLFVISQPAAISASKAKLTPPALAINNARDDRGSFQCESSFDSGVSVGESCRLNIIENPSHRFLLFGNSHADMIKHNLEKALSAKNQSLRLIKGYDTISSTEDRQEFIDEAVRQNVQTIVIQQTLQAGNGQYLRGFIEKAAEHSINIVFISPVPIYFYNVPQKLYEDYLATGQVNSKGMNAEEHYKQAAVLFRNLSAYAEEFGNFTWYDGARNLCDVYCIISDEQGRPLYYDNNHLTLTGVAYLDDIFLSISEL